MTNILIVSKHIQKHFHYLAVKRTLGTGIIKFSDTIIDSSNKNIPKIDEDEPYKIEKPSIVVSPYDFFKMPHYLSQFESVADVTVGNDSKTEILSNETILESDPSGILQNLGEELRKEPLPKNINQQEHTDSNAVQDTPDDSAQSDDVISTSSLKPILEGNLKQKSIFETFWSSPVSNNSVRHKSSDSDTCHDTFKDTCKNDEPEVPCKKEEPSEKSCISIPDVPGLSEKVLKVSEPVGPGAGKSEPYKNPEYYSYQKYSFYDAQLELEECRLPQPNAKIPYFHEPKK